jgi:carboxyl-terminal processing protease
MMNVWNASAPIVVASILSLGAAVPLPAQLEGERCWAAAVADALADVFQAKYVLPAPAADGARALRRRRWSDGPETGEAALRTLADTLTRVLRSSTGDGHVLVEWIGRSGPAASRPDWIARWKADAPRSNYGVPKVEILPGNVGHLALRSFHTYADAAPTLRAAMTLVGHTEGLILDLRQNGGGDDVTARAVGLTFLPPGSDWPLRTETRRGRDTAAAVPALGWDHYRPERPLVVLIDGRSFSAPEAVTFVLAHAGRAVVIGTRSAGGAHMFGDAARLPCGLQAWIPDRRPIHVQSGSNWEGSGVAPHVEAPGASAVPIAHLHLLRLVRARSSDPERQRELDRIIAESEASVLDHR